MTPDPHPALHPALAAVPAPSEPMTALERTDPSFVRQRRAARAIRERCSRACRGSTAVDARGSTAAAASMRFLTGTVPHVAFPCRAGML